MATEVYFNRPGRPIDLRRLFQDVYQADESLILASAWFTDEELAKAVIASRAPNKLVVLNKSDLMRAGRKAYETVRSYFDLAGKQVRGGVYSLGSKNWEEGVMHHKLIVLDAKIVWLGSYNFTFQARKNYETLVRVDDRWVAGQFAQEIATIVAGKVPDCTTLKPFNDRKPPGQSFDPELTPSGHVLVCTECRGDPSEDENREWGLVRYQAHYDSPRLYCMACLRKMGLSVTDFAKCFDCGKFWCESSLLQPGTDGAVKWCPYCYDARESEEHGEICAVCLGEYTPTFWYTKRPNSDQNLQNERYCFDCLRATWSVSGDEFMPCDNCNELWHHDWLEEWCETACSGGYSGGRLCPDCLAARESQTYNPFADL